MQGLDVHTITVDDNGRGSRMTPGLDRAMRADALSDQSLALELSNDGAGHVVD